MIGFVQYDKERDEYYLVSDALKKAGMKEGDVVSWKDNGDNTFTLTKEENVCCGCGGCYENTSKA